MKKVTVPLQERSYDIFIGNGLLKELGNFLNTSKNYVIITDKNIPTTYIETVKSQLNVSLVITLDPGEQTKSFQTVEMISNTLIEHGITRDITFIALGGGVIGDVTGFIASIYMRGVDFIQIPTSLLAQVDSSVGGKTGINANHMKNAIGTFHQPKAVIIDPVTLSTLEERHFNNGMAELIKHSLINGKRLFKDLINNFDKSKMEDYIYQSVTIKKDIVIQDEFDHKVRQILNFGHTIGHALEEYSNYDLLHGEAISIGMCLMSKGTTYEKDLISLFQQFNLPTTYDYDVDKVYKLIQTDKKIKDKTLNLIIIKELGNPIIKPIRVDDIKLYL